MEHIDLAPPVATPPRHWFRRLAVAIGLASALYAAPFSYFLTACAHAPDVSDRLVWMLILLAAFPFLFPAYFALGAIALVGLLFAASRTPQTIRMRNVVAPIAIAGLVVGALVFGAVAPTSCSFF